MITHKWTSNDIQTDFGHLSTLHEVLKVVEQKSWQNGQVVCEIFVNGLRIDESDEGRFADEKIDKIHSLSIQTADPLLLLEKTTSEMVLVIPPLVDQCVQTAEAFRLQQLPQAYQKFSDLLETCRYVTDVIFIVKSHDASNFSTDVEATYQLTIRQILEAFERLDGALLADLLEYELTNVLLQIKQQLSKLVAYASLEK